MTAEADVTAQERPIETVSSFGLLLNIASVLVMAISLAGLGLGNGLAALCSAVAAVVAFGASLAFFAMDAMDQ
jgi:hypothetical protein